MDSKPSQSGRGRSTSKRVRGVILSPQGWQRFHQDCDTAVDASVFYGREGELTQLWQWIVSERCRIVGLLGIGGIGKSPS